MNISSYLFSRSAVAAAIATLLILPAACVVAPDGGQVSYGGGYPGYYEPTGAYYGGWSPGYYVAPYRDGHHFEGRGVNRAAVSRSTPSLPAAHANVHAGGGGGHVGGGGGHDGGGHR